MKKILKKLGMLSLVCVFAFSTAVGCKVKQSKADDRANLVKDSVIHLNRDKTLRSFKTDYKQVETTGKNKDEVITTTIKTHYDHNKNEASVDTRYVVADKDNNIEERSVSYKVYMKDGFVYVKNLESKEEKETSYTGVYSFLKISDSSVATYSLWVEAPYNGCTSGSEEEVLARAAKLPDILPQAVKRKTCSVEKKVFGKDYTYTLSYELSAVSSVVAEIVTNKQGDITSIVSEVSRVRENLETDTIVTELNVSFD